MTVLRPCRYFYMEGWGTSNAYMQITIGERGKGVLE